MRGDFPPITERGEGERNRKLVCLAFYLASLEHFMFFFCNYTPTARSTLMARMFAKFIIFLGEALKIRIPPPFGRREKDLHRHSYLAADGGPI